MNFTQLQQGQVFSLKAREWEGEMLAQWVKVDSCSYKPLYGGDTQTFSTNPARITVYVEG